jgi:hypothetical protein
MRSAAVEAGRRNSSTTCSLGTVPSFLGWTLPCLLRYPIHVGLSSLQSAHAATPRVKWKHRTLRRWNYGDSDLIAHLEKKIWNQ